MAQFNFLLAAAQNGMPFQVITLLAAPREQQSQVGSMFFLSAAGEINGEIISPEFSQRVAAFMQQRDIAMPGMFAFDDNRYKFFADSVKKPRQAVICGAGHISVPLTEFLSRLDYSVTVIDDRPEFAAKRRFPLAKQVICDSFAKALTTIKTDEQTAVVIVTRGHRYDADCLRLMIHKQQAYLGMIGSRRRIQAIRQILTDEGITPEQLQRVYAPIGLDIGAKTPAEIALAIAAEIVSVCRGGTHAPLSVKAVGHGY